MVERRYFGEFEGIDDVREEFAVPPTESLLDHEVLFASYGEYYCEGYAVVIFERGGTLFEVHGSHNSIGTLVGQWTPEATTWAELAARKSVLEEDEHEPAAYQRMDELLAEHAPPREVAS